MKVYSTISSTLLGWYLMSPPLTLQGLTDVNATLIDGDAPLSRWSVVKSFDSAEKCERERELGQEHLRKAMRDNPGFLKDRDHRLEAMQILLEGSAQCIATDDPRLKGD